MVRKFKEFQRFECRPHRKPRKCFTEEEWSCWIERSIASARWGRGEKRDSFWLALIWVTTIRLNFPIWIYRNVIGDAIAIVSHSVLRWQFSCLIPPPEKSWPFMGYRTEHFLLQNAKQGTCRKIGGPRNTSRTTKSCKGTCNFVISFWICSRRKPFCQQTSLICALACS